jgi:uncharacterized protein YqeY
MSDDTTLLDRIDTDLKQAMRDKDKVRLRTLRSVRAALQNKAIEQRQGGADVVLSEQDQLAVLRKQANQRKDSIKQYENAGREDLAEKERAELAVIEEYLPAALSDEELEETLQVIIDDVGAESMADMGSVMGWAMSELRGRADGSRVQQTVRDLLS